MDIGSFIQNYGLILLLIVLLVFMFWSSRRRMAKQKAEQEAKARQTVPGAQVLLQGGLYGTIIAYDPDNLDQPAIVELAPGVDVKVHSQAILRIINPSEDAVSEDEVPVVEPVAPDYADADSTPAAAERDAVDSEPADPDAEPGAKPQA